MADAILNLSGLPPLRTATFYDLLARTRREGKWQSIPVRVVTISKDGMLTVTGLRDSRYALLFSGIGVAQYSRYKLDVGDKSKYRRIYLSDPLPAPVLHTVTVFVRMNEIVSTIEWNCNSDLAVVAFDLYRKNERDNVFRVVHSVTDRSTRSCEVTGLLPETSYQWYIVARGIGLQSPKSNVVECMTPVSPVAEPNLIENGNFETAVW